MTPLLYFLMLAAGAVLLLFGIEYVIWRSIYERARSRRRPGPPFSPRRPTPEAAGKPVLHNAMWRPLAVTYYDETYTKELGIAEVPGAMSIAIEHPVVSVAFPGDDELGLLYQRAREALERGDAAEALALLRGEHVPAGGLT